MRLLSRCNRGRCVAACFATVLALLCAACGTSESDTQTGAAQPSSSSTTSSTVSTTSTTSSTTASNTATAPLPGADKPPVTIGDKNYTEQFVIGELYRQALQAEGFNVQLNQNIGPTDVTLQALEGGSLAMYPEYLNVFDSAVAKYHHGFRTRLGAYRAAQRYAFRHGLELLSPTPFSDTNAIGVTVGYAHANHLRSLGDLSKVQNSLTLGGPPTLEQTDPRLSQIEQLYGFTPHGFQPLAVGAEYGALNDGTVQAAEVQTTDGQLASGDYRLLSDSGNAFGWGNVVPVVSARTINAEGPVFAATIDNVNSQLTTRVIRRLNQAVDVSGQDPTTVAHQFLETHGLIPASPP